MEKGLTDLFSRMVDKGADLLTVDEEGRTLLHDAAAGGPTAIIETLLDRKLDVNQRGSGWTPLHYAADRGHLAAIELLLARGADLQARTSVMGQTAANLADESGDQKTLALLAAKGLALSPPTFPELRGEYLGQTKPGRKAEVFAPGIVNVPYTIHSNIVFSPDGRYLLFVRNMDICVSFGDRDGQWSEARPFGPEVNTPGMEILPVVSPDGKYLFFKRNARIYWIDAGIIDDLRASEGTPTNKK